MFSHIKMSTGISLGDYFLHSLVKVIISLELSSTESKSQCPWLCTFLQGSSYSC